MKGYVANCTCAGEYFLQMHIVSTAQWTTRLG